MDNDHYDNKKLCAQLLLDVGKWLQDKKIYFRTEDCSEIIPYKDALKIIPTDNRKIFRIILPKGYTREEIHPGEFLKNLESSLIKKYCPPLYVNRKNDFGRFHSSICVPLNIAEWEQELREKFHHCSLKLIRVPDIDGGSVKLLMTPEAIKTIFPALSKLGTRTNLCRIDVPIKNLSAFKQTLDKLSFNPKSNFDKNDIKQMEENLRLWNKNPNFSIEVDETDSSIFRLKGSKTDLGTPMDLADLRAYFIEMAEKHSVNTTDSPSCSMRP